MRITSAQESYLVRLLNEAFSKRYSPTPFGHIAINQVHNLTRDNANNLIQHLLAAKARGWTSWETTSEGKAKAAAEETRSTDTRKRVEIIKSLKAQGFLCDGSCQDGDKSKCPLHSLL